MSRKQRRKWAKHAGLGVRLQGTRFIVVRSVLAGEWIIDRDGRTLGRFGSKAAAMRAAERQAAVDERDAMLDHDACNP